MIRDMDDFCFDAAGKKEYESSCFVHLNEKKCGELGGEFWKKREVFACEFRDTRRAQERVGTIKMSEPLTGFMREKIIKEELQKGLPPEMSQFIEELSIITEGLNAYGIVIVMDELREGYLPVEEAVKRSGIYRSGEPIEPQIKAFEIAHGLMKGIKEAFTGFTKEDKERALLPAIDEAEVQRKNYKNLIERRNQLLKFKPDSKNRSVWEALIKYPDALEVWDENPKPYPEGIKKIVLDQKYPGEEIWAIVDNKKDGAFISFYPQKNEVEMNSPYSEEE